MFKSYNIYLCSILISNMPNYHFDCNDSMSFNMILAQIMVHSDFYLLVNLPVCLHSQLPIFQIQILHCQLVLCIFARSSV